MTTDDDFADIQRLVAARLQAAMSAQAETRRQSATARSEHGDVTLTVDARGFLSRVEFDASMAELTAEELAAEVLDTLRVAQQELVPQRPATGGLADLHDDTVARRLRGLYERRMAEARGETR